MSLIALSLDSYLPIVWSVLALAGIVGLIAVASPQVFAKIDRVGNRWIDTSRWLAKLDRPIDVDARVLPHSRILGSAVLASVGLVAWMIVGRH